MNCVLLKGTMVIDIWRVLILYKYGGMYTDVDNTPISINQFYTGCVSDQ